MQGSSCDGWDAGPHMASWGETGKPDGTDQYPCPVKAKLIPLLLSEPAQLTFQIHQSWWLPLCYEGELVGEQHACTGM
jgi:hypothetical protein